MSQYDFEVRAGNSGTIDNPAGLVFVLRDSQGALVPVTGATFVFVCRPNARDAIAVRKTSENGGVVVDAAQSRITVPFTVADTRAMWGTASSLATQMYEVERRDAGGVQRTVLFGKITVHPGVNDD